MPKQKKENSKVFVEYKGKSYAESSNRKTLFKVINKIGGHRVNCLNIQNRGFSLLTTEQNRYSSTDKVDGYYVTITASSEEISNILIQISNNLDDDYKFDVFLIPEFNKYQVASDKNKQLTLF